MYCMDADVDMDVDSNGIDKVQAHSPCRAEDVSAQTVIDPLSPELLDPETIFVL